MIFCLVFFFIELFKQDFCYNLFILSTNTAMYTTSKSKRMISQLQIQQPKKTQIIKAKNLISTEGRVVILCLTTWYFGYVFCQMSPLSPYVLQPYFGTFMTQQRGVGPCFGLIPLGAAVGVIISNLIINKVSRRNYLIVLNILNLGVTGAIQAGDVITLYIFRVFQGMLVGNFMTLVPTYINQITPKQSRSRFGIYPQISVVLGVLWAYILGVIFTDSFNITDQTIPTWQSELNWRFILITPAMPSVIQLFCILIGYIPQSPQTLIIQNKRQKARQVYSMFYDDEYVDKILQQKQDSIFNHNSQQQQSKVNWTGKGYFIGILLSVMQVLSGIASFVTQAGHVMQFTFKQYQIGLYTPVLITISQLIGTFVSIPIIKYMEWRKVTIIGGFSLAAFDGLIGMFLYFFDQAGKNNNSQEQTYMLLLTCIGIMGFMFTFGITLGSSVWPYIGMMMPPSGVTLALVINWILAGLSIIAFSFVTASMKNPYVMMWVYCGVTFVTITIFSFISVDVKGLSVRKVQMHLE